MHLLVTAGLAAGVLALGTAPAAAAAPIEITPATAVPGESIMLRSACDGPAERLQFTSPAFQGAPSAELDRAGGSVPVVVAPGTPPGDYDVLGECVGGSGETVEGEVTVVRGRLTPTPLGAPQTGGGGLAPDSTPIPLAAAGAALLALGGGAAVYGLRARSAR